MHPTPDLIALLMLERERDVASQRLATLASRARSCCSPSRISRLVRALRPAPATCASATC